MSVSSIEWTDRTWNPVRGCSRVSEGCRNCYAERIAVRMSGPGQWGEGFADVPRRHSETGAATTGVRGKWTGKVALVPEKLDEPLRWRKSQRVFVNSMSDLFHESLPDEAIAAVFGVMASAPRHTFQVLTKRPGRMVEFFRKGDPVVALVGAARRAGVEVGWPVVEGSKVLDVSRPLPNVWLGVSVEDQATADERIPLLLQTPAAKRFVSYEPALGSVHFGSYLFLPTLCRDCGARDKNHYDPNPFNLPNHPARPGGCFMGAPNTGEPGAIRCNPCGSLNVEMLPTLDWIIVGGESGPGARPFDVAWARSTVEQCKAAGVAVFVKQLGARPFQSPRTDGGTGWVLDLKSPKGGDPAEWPADLRVREFPR